MALHEEHLFKRFCNDDVAGLEVQVKYVIRVYEVDGFAHLKEPAAATPKRASFPKRAVAFSAQDFMQINCTEVRLREVWLPFRRYIELVDWDKLSMPQSSA